MPSTSTIGWRTALTEHGDTLQHVAFRELQDASRWPEIAWINDLRPPYLTGDGVHPGVAAGQVLLWGSAIKIPGSSTTQKGVSPTESFGRDVLLENGAFGVEPNGGLSLADGVGNLRQALQLRLENEVGCLKFHPRYGNSAPRLRGHKSNPSANLLALRYCEETVLADPRVKSVSDGSAKSVGSAIFVELTALIDNGSTLRLQIEI